MLLLVTANYSLQIPQLLPNVTHPKILLVNYNNTYLKYLRGEHQLDYAANLDNS